MKAQHAHLDPTRRKLGNSVDKQVQRLERAEKDRPTVLAHTVYLGVLGLVFVLPVLGGAYLGRWIDGFVEGYSIRWTLSMMFLGLAVGAANVYLLIRE